MSLCSFTYLLSLASKFQCPRHTLIGLGICFYLSQYHTVGAGKRTDHMDGRLPIVPVIGTAQYFAIDGDQLPFGALVDRLHPFEET